MVGINLKIKMLTFRVVWTENETLIWKSILFLISHSAQYR